MPFSDFSRFSRCLSVGLHIGLPLRGIPMRPPGVSDESFPLCCRMYLRGSVQLSDFAVARQLIHLSDLLCASCSSAQGFAYAFLQIPPHDGHPWPRLTVPAVGPVKSFHLLGSSHAQHTWPRQSLGRPTVAVIVRMEKQGASRASHRVGVRPHQNSNNVV